MADKELERKEAVEYWLTLKAVDFAYRLELPVGAIENLKVVELNLAKGIWAIKTWLLGKKQPGIHRWQEVEFKFPTTPWQFFKERYLKFLHKRFPVQYGSVKQRVEWDDAPIYICPHLKNYAKERHLNFLKTGDGIAEEVTKGDKPNEQKG